MRILIDRLEQARKAQRAASGAGAAASSPSSAAPGLKFQPGAAVLDLASGKRGTVLAGVRDDATGRQLYSVELKDGTEIFRSVSELGADTFPAAPAQR
jgi:hypothetical protein